MQARQSALAATQHCTQPGASRLCTAIHSSQRRGPHLYTLLSGLHAHAIAAPARQLSGVHHQSRHSAKMPAATAAAEHDNSLAMLPPSTGVTAQIFRFLSGRWALTREVRSSLHSTPSGSVTGHATFTPTATPGEYLYSERAVFSPSAGGPQLRAWRKYLYAHDERSNRLCVYLTDGSHQRGTLYLNMELLEQQQQQQGTGSSGAEHEGTSSSRQAGSASSSAGVPLGGHDGSHQSHQRTSVDDIASSLDLLAAELGKGHTGRGAAARTLDGSGTAALRQGASAAPDRQEQHQTCEVQPLGGASSRARLTEEGVGAWTGRWIGRDKHPCVKDMYYASYWFTLAEGQLVEWGTHVTAKGPVKDYVIETACRRSPE